MHGAFDGAACGIVICEQHLEFEDFVTCLVAPEIASQSTFLDQPACWPVIVEALRVGWLRNIRRGNHYGFGSRTCVLRKRRMLEIRIDAGPAEELGLILG